MGQQSGAVAESIRLIFEGVVAEGLRRDSVIGASDEEIDRFAVGQGVVSVPSALREVLRLVGVEPGLWFAGTDFGIDLRPDVKVFAEEALSTVEHCIRDPAGMLVLSSHQGYAYHVIDGADLGSDDPPVWDVIEHETGLNGWHSVSSWFEAVAPDIADLRAVMRSMARMGDEPPWAADIVSDGDTAER